MENLSDHDLLSVWEYGLNHSLIETNLYLISLAYRQYDFNQTALMSIGERDAHLIDIRNNLFGPVLDNVSDCPGCSEKVEWETKVDELRLQKTYEANHHEPIELSFEDFQVKFRLPNSYDIFALPEEDEIKVKMQKLLAKCLVEPSPSKKNAGGIPEALQNQIIQQMEIHDPQANVLMNLTCPECENKWEAIFDITQFLWVEINDWAIHLLQDIQMLARNFGWSEHDILSMSRIRRSIYLKMIGG